ncbi:MAG: hypothetical protein ACI4AQ_09290 [Lachnospiraceae bacterium]
MGENKSEFLKLGNEFITRRYLFNKAEIGKVLSAQDYIAMHFIAELNTDENIYGGKAYLSDISEKMQLTIRQTSRLASGLKERGLVKWSHDGDGSDGTYVMITQEGKNLLNQQESIVREYYGRVIEKYGKDNLIQLLNLMKQLETVMGSELEEMEDISHDAETE